MYVCKESGNFFVLFCYTVIIEVTYMRSCGNVNNGE